MANRSSGAVHRASGRALTASGESPRAKLAPRRRSWRQAVVAVAGMALVASTTVAGVASSASAAGGPPIVVGGIFAKSDFTGTDLGFQARIARLNRQGGINGRQVKFVGALDDGESSATDLTDAQNLILNDHVVAIAPIATSGFLTASESFAATHHTPYIGWGFLPAFCGSKWGYGFNGCLVGNSLYNTSIVAPAISFVSKNPSTVRAAIISNTTTVGEANKTLYNVLFPKLGAKVVYDDDPIPISGVINYAPYISAVMATHPNLIIEGMSFSQVAAFVSGLRAAGYTGASLDYQTYVPGLLKSEPTLASALKSELIDAQIPPQEGHSPAVVQLGKDLAAINQPTSISIGEQVGYWSADELIQMLQATAKAGRPLTGAGIEATVNKGFTYKGTIPGGVGTLVEPKDENAPVPCAVLLQVNGTAYKVVKPFSCYKNIPAS